ncbi:MAG: hypothetical protein M5R36_10530 [Deltaproteobacteria bacterium]|nr:hypothetical protein [Deltaproteobacteria bacterium]
MKRLIPPLLFMVMAAAAPALAAADATDVTLESSDGVILAARYFAGGEKMPAVVLLHMLSRHQGDWNDSPARSNRRATMCSRSICAGTARQQKRKPARRSIFTNSIRALTAR